MQRLNAATCLLFAMLGWALPCHSRNRLRVEVVQTHTGVRLGASEQEISVNASQVLTGCNGKSGTYARELGFYCADSGFPVSPEPAESRRGYAFFYDVRVIMPDKARLVFHCSTVLDRACEGFPTYPEDTSVECSDFAQSGVAYKDCTASGPSAGSIGVYRASLHGDRMTIFGSNWRRSYLQNGTWQFRVAALAANPSPPQRTEANSPAQYEIAQSLDPCQDQEPAPPQEPKPAPAQEDKPTPLPEPKPVPQEEKPAPEQETKPAPAQEDKPAPPPETGPPAEQEKPAQTQEPQPTPAQDTKPAPASVPTQETNNSGVPGNAPLPITLADRPLDPQIIEQAKAGDMEAQYKLGYDYYLGHHGVALDYVQAAIWWKKAAEQGYPAAQNNLGVLYNSGQGVPQSYTEAYFWQNLAAARANVDQLALFAKNRDDSAAKLWLLSRLGVQRRAAKWAAEHPVPPRSHEPKTNQK